MRKHLQVERMQSMRNFDGGAFLDEAENCNSRMVVAAVSAGSKIPLLFLQGGEGHSVPEEALAVDGRRSGKRRKKKKGDKLSPFSSQKDQLQ
mmetsp:Transcript_1831/g.2851  ORF Transcript_1831/g.2851 Transcript_1831/m.2851 type:complete len:92 (-) Transcript_1831:1004-1279(-)